MEGIESLTSISFLLYYKQKTFSSINRQGKPLPVLSYRVSDFVFYRTDAIPYRFRAAMQLGGDLHISPPAAAQPEDGDLVVGEAAFALKLFAELTREHEFHFSARRIETRL